MFEKTKFGRWYRYAFTELADPRTNHWPLIKHLYPLAIFLILWTFFVLKWGPRMMANRPAFKLQKVLVVYNAIQVVISLALVFPGLYLYTSQYSWKCEPIDRSRSPMGMKVALVFYAYFLAKLTELMDTVFFVLRKKDRQISFLHVIHHVGMPLLTWGGTKYYPGGHIVLSGMFNCMVHVVMYTYYMISAMGPQYQKYLWWKKYITTMQLIQFVLILLHNSQLFWNDCGFPRWIMIVVFPNAFFMFVMFSDFYKQEYNKKRDIKAAKEKELLAANDINGNVLTENKDGKTKVQ